MKLNVWVAGAIVAIVIICFIAVAAITMALQGPSKPTSGACSVNGYVVSSMGKGIPGTMVTLYIMGHNGSADAEIYNMTAPTMGSSPYVGMFVFDNVVITPDTQYAYLSTSFSINNTTYLGRTDNFTLVNNSSINQSIVMHMPSLNGTSVYGSVVNSYGTGMSNITVTLHMTGVAGDHDLSNLTTVTDGTGSSAGAYTFFDVVPVAGTQYGYVSAEVQPTGNMTIYGRSNNFTFEKGSFVSSFIVMHVPPEYLNETLNST
ncbi:MAG TPA: hypothetical protein VGK13_07295 [Methanocellaceae archaeon]|jgi:hypothetical protein